MALCSSPKQQDPSHPQMLVQQGRKTQAATALSSSSIVVGMKSWEHLWRFPCPLRRFSFPSPFPRHIPDPRVNVPSSVCVSASRSRSALPFGPVIFGPAGGEKQDLLIPYLLAVILKEPAGPGSSPCGLADIPGHCCAPGNVRVPRCALGGTKEDRQNHGADALLAWESCRDRDEPGTGCARARALPAGETFAGAAGKAEGLSFKGL